MVDRSVEVSVGSTKIKLVYGADPRIGNKTFNGDSVYVFEGGVMANSGVMITVSLDVGMELTWDSSLSVCLSVRLSVTLFVCLIIIVIFSIITNLYGAYYKRITVDDTIKLSLQSQHKTS